MDTKASARQGKTVVEIQNGNLRNHYESTPVKYGEPPVKYCLRKFTGQAKKGKGVCQTHFFRVFVLSPVLSQTLS